MRTVENREINNKMFISISYWKYILKQSSTWSHTTCYISKNPGTPKIHFSHLLGSQFPSSNQATSSLIHEVQSPPPVFPDPLRWSHSSPLMGEMGHIPETQGKCFIGAKTWIFQSMKIGEDWLPTKVTWSPKKTGGKKHNCMIIGCKTIIAYFVVTLFLKVASQQHVYMHILPASNYFEQKAVQIQNHRLQMGFGKSMIHTYKWSQFP